MDGQTIRPTEKQMGKGDNNDINGDNIKVSTRISNDIETRLP